MEKMKKTRTKINIRIIVIDEHSAAGIVFKRKKRKMLKKKKTHKRKRTNRATVPDARYYCYRSKKSET